MDRLGMKSGHKCICICVGLASFFGCMAMQPVATLLLLWGVVKWASGGTKKPKR
jgi:hypothetical protein